MLTTMRSLKSRVKKNDSSEGDRDVVFRPVQKNGEKLALGKSVGIDGIRLLTKEEKRKNWTKRAPQLQAAHAIQSANEMGLESKKREFLKVAGVVGLGAAATFLGAKKAEALVFGSTPASNVVGMKDVSNTRINPAKEDGNLAAIKTNTDGLVASGGGGFVRQDSTATIAKESGGNLASIKTSMDSLVTSGGGGYIRQDSTGTIAKESGGNLATIATNLPVKGQALMAASTPVVIASNQTAIPVSGSFSVEAVGLKNTASTTINPATDESVFYLRRMVKLMESQATVDAANRQRVTVDAFAAGLALPAVTAITNALPAGANAIGAITNVATIGLYDRQMFQDVAKNAFANGIRRNLTFS